MKQYHEAVRHVLEHGTRKENRTGVDTLSTFNINYSIDLRDGFPLMTTKEVSWKNIVVENLWFLSGATDIALLRKHGCKFWDPWADANGKVPSAYGNFWRNYPIHDTDGRVGFNDQIRYVLETLRSNPHSRRMVVSAWAPGNAQTSGLPPCHLMFIFNVQVGADNEPMLCCHLTQRSADIALGVPYNIAGYAFLVELFSRFTGIRPGIFGHTLVDAHIYTAKADGSMAEYDHVPGLREQLTRDERPLPRLSIDPKLRGLDDLRSLMELDTDALMSHFRLEGYDPHPPIKFKVAV
ncbi:MAG: thymidylate synthase [Myxococcota bacterium]